MKTALFFMISAAMFFGCQKPEEEIIDLDEMVLNDGDFDTAHLAGDPIFSPQELLIEEALDDSSINASVERHLESR